ncbi:MAG: flagellar basal body P-ring formation chaperone FlgA [Bacteroidota bacterium]
MLNRCKYILILLFIAASQYVWAGRLPDNRQIAVYLKSRLPEYKSVEFEIATLPRLFREISIDTGRTFRNSGAIGYLPVIVNTGKGNPSRSVITLRLKLFLQVYTAMRDIRRGETVSYADFISGIKDVAQLKGTPVRTGSFSGYIADASIRQGDVLMQESLSEGPLVRRGEKVTAYSVRGNLEISLEATARQDGAAGKIISIVTSDNKLFRAKVIDKGLVNIVD